MQLKENFYIIFKDNEFILTNYETHESYALSREKLAALAAENAYQDEEFIAAGIVALQYSELRQTKKWPYAPISKIFFDSIKIYANELEVLEGKEFWENYLGVCKETLANRRCVQATEYLHTIDLPEHRKIDYNLYDALKNRRTSREFYSKKITLQELADILFITFGKFHAGFGEKYLDISNQISWRTTSPSAGGLHPLDIYLLIEHVEGIEPGIYYYDGKNNKLNMIEKGFTSDLVLNSELYQAMLGQTFYQGASFHILSVGNLDIVAQKYSHSRSALFPYLDNGHAFQTAMLVTTSLGLQNWITAAFCDEYFQKKLNLSKTELPIAWLSIGHGCNESLGPKIRKVLEEIGLDRVVNAVKHVFSKEKVVNGKGR